MYGVDDIDLKNIAIDIAKEPATKEDGTPLVSNGKEVTKVEKILRSWAISDNPELQKRYMDLLNNDEISPDFVRTLIDMCVIACCTTDEMRIDILEKLKISAEKFDCLDAFEKLIENTRKYEKRAKFLIPHNNRGPIPEDKPETKLKIYEQQS